MQRHLLAFILLVLAPLCSTQIGWAQPSSDGHTVPINGMEMHYESYGRGDPLVLLHAFAQSGQAWRPVITDLAKEYQVIIPDLRGHGRSTNPAGQFTHRQSALDVFALLDHLQVDRVKAMGISSGGMTLLHMATQQPARVESMVLIGTAPYFPEQARTIHRQVRPDNRTEEDWESMRQIHKHGDAQIRALWTQFHNFKDSYDDMNFTAPYLSTITARTLIVHGDRDEPLPVSIAMEMYAAVPRASLWIVPDGGHIPIFGNMTQHFTDTALAFLHGEWGSQ